MDLVYMSDALSYHSIRTPIYDRYEYKQNTTYNKGGINKAAESDAHRSGSKCPICREKQKRKLSAYIRSKCSNEKNRIVEEEEESQGGTCAAH